MSTCMLLLTLYVHPISAHLVHVSLRRQSQLHTCDLFLYLGDIFDELVDLMAETDNGITASMPDLLGFSDVLVQSSSSPQNDTIKDIFLIVKCFFISCAISLVFMWGYSLRFT